MTNALYDSGREAFLTADIDWRADVVKIALVRGYTPSLASHVFLSDVTAVGGVIAARSPALTSRTASAGVADGADIVFTAVPSGSACDHLVIYVEGATDGDSPLIGLIDTATNLPVTPNDGDISVVWDDGMNRIFKL